MPAQQRSPSWRQCQLPRTGPCSHRRGKTIPQPHDWYHGAFHPPALRPRSVHLPVRNGVVGAISITPKLGRTASLSPMSPFDRVVTSQLADDPLLFGGITLPGAVHVISIENGIHKTLNAHTRVPHICPNSQKVSLSIRTAAQALCKTPTIPMCPPVLRAPRRA
ncbi:unnamed protein product [Chondrus crispus]|uniref:Uncharacterized protein n=1 Tax=Chondrus crispus TaxID=2769 RepID=R7QEK5_CHOCR|nr:unnamed protein product [Chondrus crispus]CDF36942.1 unnamed protein product [Chondrus crispus]|eukprot:XP_005716761.1 unnamed protein product [Chondrus crispus]